VRPACEILEQATLAARFNFDGSSPLVDQGPNKMPSSGSNYAIVAGRSLNGISFTSSSSSYLQAAGFLALAIPNQPFSISLWITPASLAGTLVHLSDSSLGSGTCSSFLGFASNGSLIAQVLTSTHVALTWSSPSGLRLFFDNVLIGSRTATTRVGNSAWLAYVTLASCLNRCGTCNAGQVSPGQFAGAIDDFRVYIRELTTTDICTL
jgi:hypothetical protein